jgi:hypothetical protein
MLNRLFLAALTSLVIALPARATSVVPLYLDEIVDTATTVIHGTCIGNRSDRDPQTGMIVTYTTFQVHDVMKGNAGFTHVIKQIGGELPDKSFGFKVQGIPRFTVGQSYVVFLAGVSSAGFSSPIGLGQGRFSVVSDEKGAHVTNGRDFKEMTSRMAQEVPQAAKSKLQEAGPVTRLSLEAFKQLVRQRVGGTK